MNLLTIKEFCTQADVKKAAVSRAVKAKNVVYFRGGNTKPIQIDADNQVNRAYIESMSAQRLTANMDDVIDGMVTILPADSEVDTETLESIKNDAARFAKHRADKERESVRKLKIQNKHLDAQYLEKDVIYNGLILYIDSIHSAIDRFFGVVVDDLGPRILAGGEVTPDIMQDSIDEGHKIIDDCKTQMLVKINQIVKDIEKKK